MRTSAALAKWLFRDIEMLLVQKSACNWLCIYNTDVVMLTIRYDLCDVFKNNIDSH